jgi:hypothetical protein
MCDPSRRQPMGVAAEAFVRERFSTGVIAARFVHLLTTSAVPATRTGGFFRHRRKRQLPG